MNTKILIKTEFGLETLVKWELEDLGYSDIEVHNGYIIIEGKIEDVAKLNIYLRTAERVMVIAKETLTRSFEELFQATKSIPWEEWIEPDGQIIVNGRTNKSQLRSVRSCQSISKKAIIERLKSATNQSYFPETGDEYKIEIMIEKDLGRILIDTTGDSLFKRGYRVETGDAPLKETLAAALVKLSYWNPDRILLDPLCGSGTILIEAAMIGRNIAPGLSRTFSAENYTKTPKEIWKRARANAYKDINQDINMNILGSDIDPDVIKMAKRNAIEAGVSNDIKFEVKDISQRSFEDDYGVMITNAPYGQRVGSQKEIKRIYDALFEIMRRQQTWSYYILTADENLETVLQRDADRRRKLYNGNIKVDYYQFYGPRPPKEYILEE
ncbi:MAG: class I SAM-dependent RNA methyltransferase [Clostridia bacterium]